MKIDQIRLFLCLFFMTTQVYGQNLVNNPSFEEGINCSDGSVETNYAEGWKALAGSPRFLNPNCPLTPEEKTYIRGMKLPNPAEGDVFIGMGIDRVGEYLAGTLKDSLKKDMRYWIKMRVRLPIPFCNTALDELGVVLTDSTIPSQQAYRSIDLPSIALKTNSSIPIAEQMKWEEISALYIAKGGETQIIIGNFADNNVENFKKREKRQCSYIYIDAIEVTEYKEISLKPYKSSSTLKVGDRYILKDIEFEVGLEKLKEGTLKSLDELALRLAGNPTLRLEISGHTDNTGDESTNRIFSKARATSVVDYLVAQGARANQLISEGAGSSKNIAVNSSENGRKKNRRIEIKVLNE